MDRENLLKMEKNSKEINSFLNEYFWIQIYRAPDGRYYVHGGGKPRSAISKPIENDGNVGIEIFSFISKELAIKLSNAIDDIEKNRGEYAPNNLIDIINEIKEGWEIL